MGSKKGLKRSYALIYFAYTVFYLCRKNYGFWLRDLIVTVGLEKHRASLFGSVMELSYGLGKLVAGPFVDTHSPSAVLAGSLAVSASCASCAFSGNAMGGETMRRLLVELLLCVFVCWDRTSHGSILHFCVGVCAVGFELSSN